jgi:hypothetical protein
MDKSKNTEIGDSAPFTEEPIHESEDAVGCGEIGDSAPFEDELSESSFFHNDDVEDDEQLPDLPFEIEIEEDVEDVPFPEVDGDYEDLDEWSLDEDEMMDDEMMGDELEEGEMMDDETMGDEIEEDEMMDGELEEDEMGMIESKIYNIVREAIELHDFGNHPAFDKAPMTLPANIEIELNGAKDWNDDSVKGEEPFGKKVGDSAPYTEKVVNMITDMIYNRLSGKKKV